VYSVDIVRLSFDAVGMLYDVVVVSPSTQLDLYLSSGVGKYSGIVSTDKSLLSLAQQQQVSSYQLQVFILFYCF
jgi:hypothetical protein